jgi:hypothetical protein
MRTVRHDGKEVAAFGPVIKKQINAS